MLAPLTLGALHPRPPSVVVAGGGIGGLFTAMTLQKQGYDVTVYEKTKEYRPFGGPIQIASNGLEAVRRIDIDLHNDIVEKSNCIGDRINGLKDGISNEWFATFDLKTPAETRGQRPSVVIDRPVLQELLLQRVGDCVTKGKEVVDCEQDEHQVTAILADGTRHVADLLVGSDGLNSKMRTIVDPAEGPASWSGYTCFAAIAYTVPADIKEVRLLLHPHGCCAAAPQPSLREPTPPCRALPSMPATACFVRWATRSFSADGSILCPLTLVAAESSGTSFQHPFPLLYMLEPVRLHSSPNHRNLSHLVSVSPSWLYPTPLAPTRPHPRYAFLNIPPGSMPDEQRTGAPAIEFLRNEFEVRHAIGRHAIDWAVVRHWAARHWRPISPPLGVKLPHYPLGDPSRSDLYRHSPLIRPTCRPTTQGWSEEVFDLLDSTPLDEVEQRDLYDRPPSVSWKNGRVVLLGDAAHPMMPNLGQARCVWVRRVWVRRVWVRRVWGRRVWVRRVWGRCVLERLMLHVRGSRRAAVQLP